MPILIALADVVHETLFNKILLRKVLPLHFVEPPHVKHAAPILSFVLSRLMESEMRRAVELLHDVELGVLNNEHHVELA